MDFLDFLVSKLGKKDENSFNTDKVLNDIVSKNNLGKYDSFFHFLNKLFNENNKDRQEKKGLGSEIENLLKEFINDGKQTLKDRTLRYNEYYAIVRMIPYAKRALKTIVSEIFSPENINKTNFVYEADDNFINLFEDEKPNVDLIIKTLKLHSRVKQAIRNACWLGDGFLEVVNMNEELERNNLLLQESIAFDDHLKDIFGLDEKFSNVPNINIQIEMSNNDIGFIIEDENNNKKKRPNLNDIMIINHNPNVVLRLGDEVCLGYLIFPKKIAEAPPLHGDSIYKVNQNDKLTLFLKKVKEKLQSNQQYIKDLEFNPDIKSMLVKLFLYHMNNDDGFNKNQINEKIKFVPAERMFHFKTEDDKYAPYGTSIFDDQEFDARLLILLKTAITIMRLSRAVEKRLVTLEFGADRAIRKVITRVKEEFERRKTTLTSTGGLDSIPSMVPTYENIYVPMINGKKFIEFDTLPNVGDPGNAIEDYKAIRDSFISGLVVPPAFLGLEENVESKATLTQQNIMFAKTIIDYQTYFEEPINDLIRYIYVVVYGKNLLSVNVKFPKPKSIELELEKNYYQSLKDYLDMIKELNLSKSKFIKKYIDPDLLEKDEDDYIDDIKNQESGENESTEGGSSSGGGGFSL